MAPEIEQLTLDVGAPTTGSSQLRDKASREPKASTCLSSKTFYFERLSALAVAASCADPGVPTARLLMQLAAAVEEAIAVSIAEAYVECRSWRELSSMLGVPFQTLHRRHSRR